MSGLSQGREGMVGRAFYFGTYRRAGHYLWTEQMQTHRWPTTKVEGLPWERIDGRLNPKHEVEGEALLHHKNGWTALAFANRMDDSRPGSNSAFLFEGTLTFDEAVRAARRRFPSVMERIDQAFDLVEARNAAA